MKFQEYKLPEFVFLDGNSHEGDSLSERTVIQHIRSYSIMEVICLDDVAIENLISKTYKFEYKNRFGVIEHYMFALHFSMEETEIDSIFERTKNWFVKYMDWEDGNILEDSCSANN